MYTEMICLEFTVKEFSGRGWGSDGRFKWNKIGHGLITVEKGDGFIEGVLHYFFLPLYKLDIFYSKILIFCMVFQNYILNEGSKPQACFVKQDRSGKETKNKVNLEKIMQLMW